MIWKHWREAALKNRTTPQEAQSLLCAKLQEREEKRKAMISHLAKKRKLSVEEMTQQLLDGSYSPIDQGEIEDELE